MIAPNIERSQVVIVDSKPNDYTTLVRSKPLGQANFEFFDSGRAALRFEPTKPPQLWVININLPDMSGLDLYHMISSRWPDSPIYLVGDDYRPEDEINARISGATFYFCKPLQSEWLAAATAEQTVSH